MSTLGKALIKSLEDALKSERGDIELRKTRIEITSDGKIERDYGKEALNKEPDLPFDPDGEYTKDGKDKKKKKKITADNVNAIPDSHSKLEPNIAKKDHATEDCDGAIDMDKSAKDRWESIKKALNSNKAILNLEEAQADDEEETPQPSEGDSEENVDHDEAAEQEINDALEESGEEEPQEEGEEEPQEEGEEEPQEEGEEDESEADLKIMQALADEGYSEAEIRHILHGHAPPQVDPLDQAKIDSTNLKAQYEAALSQHDMDNKKKLSELDTEHKKRLNDVEYESAQHKHSVPKLEVEHKKRMLDLEYEEAASAKGAQKLDIEHKKRMLDLEYEAAKKEKEIELAAKKKELEEKSKIKQEDMRNRQKERDMVRDSKTTSEDEKKGKASPLNKSEDDLYHVYHSGQKISDKPKTLKDIVTSHGSVQSMESSGHLLVPHKESTQKADMIDDDDIKDIEKADAPSWGRSKTGQLFHPEHGHVNVMHEGGKFTIRHAPQDGGTRVISSHGTKEEAKSALMNFMKNPKGETKIPGGTIGGN